MRNNPGGDLLSVNIGEACDAYISYCRSISQRIHNDDLPNDVRSFAIKHICHNYENFDGLGEKHPKPFARLFIMHLADFDAMRGRFETEMPHDELKNIYLEWRSRHLEENVSN